MDPNQEKALPPAKEPKQLDNPEHDAARRMQPEQTEKRGPSRRRLVWTAVFALALILGLFLIGFLRHRHIQNVAAAEAQRTSSTLPIVNVAKVKRAPGDSELLLPGNMTPITEAYLYARASGYVRKRYADIGDRVREGQLLAEIEQPELDEQVAQARAQLAQSEEQRRQAQANLEDSRSQLELATVTWERYRVLVSHGAISRQEADQQFAAYRSARAAVNSAQANVFAAEQNIRSNRANLDRLLALQSYEKIRAPFTGIITARTFDVGALVSGSGGSLGSSTAAAGGSAASGNAGNAGTAGTGSLVSGNSGSGELFRIAQIGTLRTLVNVPQESAPTVRPGQEAKIFVQEISKEPFTGRVTRTANAIDLNTRTLLTEVQVANPKQLMLPGMYAQVQLTNIRPDPPLLVPGDSIMTEAGGVEVAILEKLKDEKDREGREYPPEARRIHIQKVDVGRDYGAQIEITRGLQGWEYVVVNPGDAVEEGSVVKPQNAPKIPGQGNAERRGQSDRSPNGIPSEAPGMADQGGRGASTKGAGGGKGGSGNGGNGANGSSGGSKGSGKGQ